MARAGELPAFARLMHEGTLCPLATSNPAESPVAWSSLATGCDAGQHGIFDFIHRKPNGYVPYLSTHRESGKMGRGQGEDRFVAPRQAPGFWRMASDAGIPTTVVRWPVTFPAEEVTGRFLAGLGVPDVTGRMGRHTFFTTSKADGDDEKVEHVTWKSGKITTHLNGPPMAGLRGVKPIRVKLVIDKIDSGVALTVGSQHVEVGLGRWSDWMSVTCKWGPVTVCHAIVKFHLVSTEPKLRLFATPLQIDPANQAFPLTQPASYGAELAEKIGPFYTLGLPEDTHAVTDGRYGLDVFLRQCEEIDRQRKAMFELELSRFDEGLLAFVFDAGDRVQHMFWSVDDEDSPAYDAERAQKYGHVIPDLYRQMDRLLGTAMEAVGADTAIYVVSDHGFAPFHRSVNLNRWLIENGYMTLNGGGEGRNLLADVDWSRTKAYAVGFTSLYLNLAGRESKGIVTAGAEAHTLRQELCDKLRRVGDAERGRPMVENVYVGNDVYDGPQKADGPDLVVGYALGYRASWQTALGGAPQQVVVDNDSLWAADHLMDPSLVPGVLATNVKVASKMPEGIDLAPTVLASLSLPIPPEMKGRSWLREARGSAEDEARDVKAQLGKTQPAYATKPEPEPVAITAGADGLDDAQRAELEQHLSDLGYL